MGNASSELQHFANTLQGISGEERKFLKACVDGKIMVSDACRCRVDESKLPCNLRL